jgi:hypothetical protein
MVIQLGTTLRNNMADQIEATVGTAGYVKCFTGSQPADCQAATSGTLLVNITLPSDWFTAASGGTASKNGTWQGTAVASGTFGHYRFYNNGTSVCHEQGSCGTGSVDLVMDAASVTSGQVVTVTSWSRSIGNA